MNEQLISCPICGDQNTHIDDVSVRVAGGTLRVRISGEDEHCRMDMSGDYLPNGLRRHTITLSGWCESGHTWQWDWRQDKGATWFTQQEGTS